MLLSSEVVKISPFYKYGCILSTLEIGLCENVEIFLQAVWHVGKML